MTRPVLEPDGNTEVKKSTAGKRHLIRPTWLRRILKCCLGFFAFLLLIPVLLYVPFIQTWIKDIACKVVHSSTGMNMDIERFRVRFPLDITLDGVLVLTEKGDTMVRARSLEADIKFIPLLRLDVQMNRVKLLDGRYNMISQDSSMVMNLKAGLVQFDSGSQVNVKSGHIRLVNPKLSHAVVNVDMDVWKQKPDSVYTPGEWLIEADRIALDDVTYSMSMLPTIKTLNAHLAKATLVNPLIDLRGNKISAQSVAIDGGEVKYITPTPYYVSTHPAPVDTISPASPPMQVSIRSLKVKLDSVLYAIQGVQPAPGLDPSYISLTDVRLRLSDFYNCASTVCLPINGLAAKERSGLEISDATGEIKIDSTGLYIKDFDLLTPHSSLSLEADIPFAVMEMNPGAPLHASVKGHLGWSDIFSFMPSMSGMLGVCKQLSPIRLDINASGTLCALKLNPASVSIKNFLSLYLKGNIDSLLELDKISGDITLEGQLRDARIADTLLAKLITPLGVKIPAFTVKGKFKVNPGRYSADITLNTQAGDLAAKGSLNLNSESYDLDLSVNGLSPSFFLPSLPVSHITGHLKACGAGFNPMHRGASTEINAHISSLDYQGNSFAPIDLSGTLEGGAFDVDLLIQAPYLDAGVSASGNLDLEYLSGDIQADIHHADLWALGFSDTECGGTAAFRAYGGFSPSTLFGDIYLQADSLDWNYADEYYYLPQPLEVELHSAPDMVSAEVLTDGLQVHADAQASIHSLEDSFALFTKELTSQVENRNLEVDGLCSLLPRFSLQADVRPDGLIGQLVTNAGYNFHTLSLAIAKDSLLNGNISLLSLSDGSMTADTLNLDISQKQNRLLYDIHLGNRPSNLPEFAQVNLNGYLSGNRAVMALRQRNAQGQTGYKLGLSAALQDSAISVHLSPLNAIIAYKPWALNADNFIEYQPGNRLRANLRASSGSSSIALRTVMTQDSVPALHVGLDNVHIQDFLDIFPDAPPVKGNLDSDLTIVYRGKFFTGDGSVALSALSYDDIEIGNLKANVAGGASLSGNTGARIGLLLNDRQILTAQGYLVSDSIPSSGSEKIPPTAFDVKLLDFPLSVANACMPAEYVALSGELSGEVTMTGTLMSPNINGELHTGNAAIDVPMANASLHLDTAKSINVTDNVLRLEDYRIFAANKNPISINGIIDASRISDIKLNLNVDGKDVCLVNNPRNSSEVYGKLFANIQASAQGTMDILDVQAKLDVLPTTDIYYTLTTTASSLESSTTTDVVKFVNLNDTTRVEQADSLTDQGSAMRLGATLNIINGAQITVNLSSNGTDKVTLSPSAQLSLTQNFMGDMRLNGTFTLGEGYIRYALPVIGEKKFDFNPSSAITWNGALLDPALNIYATDHVKANVQQSGANSRLIYFDVALSVLGRLSSPKVAFDLSTDDDMTVHNDLMSMTPDQRSQAAINLLLYGTYTGAGVTANGNLSNPLYSFIEGQLNSWAAKNIRGVNLSFGIDNYKQIVNGQSDKTTTYSYQVSKSLFDNRFKIIVGGNYSTDADADENFAENLISDISFEYTLKQTQNSDMYVKLFRHTGYENILEGEITETGVGFVYRRKLSSLKNLFRFGGNKKAIPQAADSTLTDTTLNQSRP